MRILHADTDDLDNPLRGGQPVRTYEINSRLINTNLTKIHQVTVLTATYQGAQRRQFRGDMEYQRLGITVPRWGLSSHLTYLNRLGSTIKKTPHDLIVEEFTPPFGFCNLQKYTKKPVVSIVQWFFFKDWEKRYKLPFEAMMRKRARQYAPRHLIVQTDKMGEYFKDLIPSANIYKVPCGISESALQVNSNTGSYALFLGRLDAKHKGLDDLLLAWKVLKEKGQAIPLWIVGAGQDETLLKNLSVQYGLTDLVQFKGRLEGGAKMQALSNCRFLIMPSCQETFGLTALEAMASSKPVIAYNIDHLNELLQPDWSLLSPLGNVEALARNIVQLWQDQVLCADKSKRAFEAAGDYVWDKLAARQLQIYMDITKGNKQ